MVRAIVGANWGDKKLWIKTRFSDIFQLADKLVNIKCNTVTYNAGCI